MAGYEDTKQKIISTLMGRPVGTEIQPENHQDYALNMLDYIRGLELIATSTLIGVAESNTTPVQPNSSRVCYIAGVAQNQTVVFENFIDENGNPISVTTGDMEGVFIILLWNTQYWSAQTFSTNIISQSESSTFYYNYNIRKTYESVALMNADVASPIGTDGKYIKIGELVTVVNSTTPAENGYYSYEGSENGWLLQSGFSFEVVQTTGTDINKTMSQKAVTDELALKANEADLVQLAVDTDNRIKDLSINILGDRNFSDREKYIIPSSFAIDDSGLISLNNVTTQTYIRFYPIDRTYPETNYTLICRIQVTSFTSDGGRFGVFLGNVGTGSTQVKPITGVGIYDFKINNTQGIHKTLSGVDTVIGLGIFGTPGAPCTFQFRVLTWMVIPTELYNNSTLDYAQKKDIVNYSALSLKSLSADTSKSLISNGLLPLVNKNQIDPLTWISTSGGTIDSTGHVVIHANGSAAKINIPSGVTIGNKYIMITNISNIDWINAEVASLIFYNYSQNLWTLNINKSGGSVKDNFNYAVFTASATGPIQVIVNGTNVNNSNIVPIGTELISFDAGIIGIAEWSQELEDLLAIAKTKYIGGKVLPVTVLKSLSDEDYKLPESSFKTLSDLASRTKVKYTPDIAGWDSVANGTNVTNEVVEQEVGGETLPVWRIGGTLNLTTYPSGRLWFGFDIRPQNYALEEKTYIVIIQGKVTVNNIDDFIYQTATGERLELAQDLTDGVETTIKAMGQFTYSAGSTSTKRYTYLFYTRRNSNIAEISYLAEFTTFSIFEPIEGFTIDDYILAAKQEIIRPIFSPQGVATETYVDDSVSTALGNISKLSPNDLTPIFDIEMFASGGQSLNVGGGAANNTTDWKNIPTFALGSSLYSRAFTTQAEKDAFFGDGFILMEDNAYEQYPPVTASVNTILSLLSKENKIDVSNFGYQMMPFTWGVSGSSITTMEKGTTAYNNFIECITKAKEFANKEGKTFGVRSMNWYHGEADRYETKLWYYTKMSQLFIDIDTDVKLITGQTEDVQFFTYQTSPWLGVDLGSGTFLNINIQEAQIQVVKDFPNVHLCGAMYQFAYGDFFHPSDRAVIGLQTGVAMKRVLHDGENWSDFIPLSHQVINDGTNYYIHLKFGVPSKPMRFDVSADAWHNPNGKQTNFGFKVLSAGIEQQIAEPFIVKGDTVVLTVGSDPTGMTIQYAVNGHYGGGNLCDSQNIIIRNKGIDYVIDNFAAAFSEYIV